MSRTSGKQNGCFAARYLHDLTTIVIHMVERKAVCGDDIDAKVAQGIPLSKCTLHHLYHRGWVFSVLGFARGRPGIKWKRTAAPPEVRRVQ